MPSFVRLKSIGSAFRDNRGAALSSPSFFEKVSSALLSLRKRLLFFYDDHSYNKVTKALLNLFGRT